MPRFQAEPPYQHGTPTGTAVVVVNLGTPEAPTAPALKRYLRQFLSDPRVVEIPRPVWWLILNGIILNIRPKKSAEKYAAVWMPEGSPLRVHTERQAKLLTGYLGERGHHVAVAWAMRYGAPSIADTLFLAWRFEHEIGHLVAIAGMPDTETQTPEILRAHVGGGKE